MRLGFDFLEEIDEDEGVSISQITTTDGLKHKLVDTKARNDINTIRAPKGVIRFMDVTGDLVGKNSAFAESCNYYYQAIRERGSYNRYPPTYEDIPLMGVYTLSRTNKAEHITPITVTFDAPNGTLQGGTVFMPILAADEPFILIDKFTISGKKATHTITKKFFTMRTEEATV